MLAMNRMSVLSTAVILAGFWSGGCGGGGSSSGTPTTPSGTAGGNIGATVTIAGSGVSNTTPRIATGERIRFVNNDTQSHQILTTPHVLHTDCPALNAIGPLAPGQSGVSDPLTTVRGCGFHDHLRPDDTRFRGQVLVGLGSGDPVPPDPEY